MALFPSRALADTRQIGKLTREQFALAMHLIQQKVSKGIDPPQTLTADMIPPSERGTPIPVSPSDWELFGISVHVLYMCCIVGQLPAPHSLFQKSIKLFPLGKKG